MIVSVIRSSNAKESGGEISQFCYIDMQVFVNGKSNLQNKKAITSR